jgi:hypothetical protein
MKYLFKTIKYLAAFLLSLIALIFVGSMVLYFSADRSIPVDENFKLRGKVISCEGGVTQYDSSFLKQSRQGLWEIYLKGGAEERGAAIGQLCKSLMYEQEKAFVDQIYEMIPSRGYVNFLKYLTVIYNRNLKRDIPDEFKKEIYASSLGCSHEFDFIGDAYDRQLNYHAAHDIGHVMQEYMLVGCTSFAVWGSQSADTTLIVARNFDFYAGDKFSENKLISFYFPDLGYKFASVGWAGMTGVLSGMNETGLTVTINAAQSRPPLSSKTPISIITRQILQYASNIEEAYNIALSMKSFVSESILIGSASDGYAAIIEKSPQSTVLYRENGERIISTNHFLSPENVSRLSKEDKLELEKGHSLYRYRRVEELLDSIGTITPEKAAFILRNPYGLHGKHIGWANEMAINQFIAHHTVIFQPAKRLMWVSTSPWQVGEMVAYDLGDIFKNGSQRGVDQNISKVTSIPADSLLLNNVCPKVVEFRKLAGIINEAIKERKSIDSNVLQRLVEINPDYDYTYSLIDKYNSSSKND